MKLYADVPLRRTRQIVGDVAVLAFVAVCVWLGTAVAGAIGGLRAPADGLTSAGTSFRDNMGGAAGQISGLPVLGDSLRGPFDALSGTGDQLAGVGTSVAQTVDTVARVSGVLVAVVPALVVVLLWAALRLRYASRATAAVRLAAGPDATQLLALRALTRQPLRRLEGLGPDVATRFRDGDPVTVRRLADLELRSYGLALPERRTVPG